MDLFSQAALVSIRQKSSINTIKHLQTILHLCKVYTYQMIIYCSDTLINWQKIDNSIDIGDWPILTDFGKSLTNATYFNFNILFMNK